KAGVSKSDRVAIVMPDGPETAAAFLAIASGAVAAPLNPAYKSEEFDFYIGDIGAKALVVAEGDQTPARAVADARGVPVIELRGMASGPAGAFELVGPAGAVAAEDAPTSASDIAL